MSFLQRVEKWFEVKPFSEPEELEHYVFQTQGKFGLVFQKSSYLIEIRADKLKELNQELNPSVRQLDLTILHDTLFQKVLGFSLEEQRKSKQIAYERNFSRCLSEVKGSAASFAVITRELEMDQVLEVCNSGGVMPQKSTYFYPKALGGLVMASVDQSEFNFDYGAFHK